MEDTIAHRVPYTGRPLTPFEQTRAERLGKAHEHERLMIAKYKTGKPARPGVEAIPDDYHLWHEVVEYTDELGNKKKRTRRDYPLPYTHQRYFRRFIELFLSRNAESGLTYKLGKEFVGDDVDSDYIEELLITAEENNLFVDGAAIRFYGDEGHSTYRPAQQGEVHPFYGVPSCDIFYGSKANISRREMIRAWLKRRADELSQSVPAAQLVAASAPEIPKQSKVSVTNEREASLTGLLSFGVQPSEVTEWITNYLFAPKSGKRIPKSKQRVWSLVEALCWHQVVNLPHKELSKLIGETWGVPYSARLYKQPKDWSNIVEPLKDTVLNMKITAKAEASKR